MPEPPAWLRHYSERAHHVEAALAHAGGTHSVADIAVGLSTGAFQMFTGNDSICVTEILQTPNVKTCHMFLAGGHMDELDEMLPHVEQFAREQKCQRMTVAGRKGWERSFLKTAGYTPKWYILAKDLEHVEG